MNLNRRSFFAWLLAPFVAKALPNVQHVGRAKPNPMLDKLNAYTMKHIVPRTTFDTIFPKSPIFMRLAGKPKPINGFHEWAEYGSAENCGINRNLKPRSLGMTTLIEESHPYIPGKGLAATLRQKHCALSADWREIASIIGGQGECSDALTRRYLRGPAVRSLSLQAGTFLPSLGCRTVEPLLDLWRSHRQGHVGLQCGLQQRNLCSLQ